MSALYGRLKGSRGGVTRCGTEQITARLETWHGHVEVELNRDGSYVVRTGPKRDHGTVKHEGRIDA